MAPAKAAASLGYAHPSRGHPRLRPYPLSYEVNALRGLLIGLPTNLALDFGVLAGATTAAVTVASLLLPRLAK